MTKNMLKLLIAEDEAIAREDLCSIDWESIGVEISDIAENGAQALTLAKESRPDIIISDIKMPLMSGLELARSVTSLLPDTKVIILSAYNEFEYAQKAIANDVFDYILKPYSTVELLTTVKRAGTEILSQREKESLMTDTINRLQFSKYFMKNYYFNSISEANLSDDFKSIFGMFSDSDKYAVFVVSLNKMDESQGYEKNYKMFHDLLKKLDKQDQGCAGFFEISQFAFVLNFEHSMSDYHIKNVILYMMDSITDYLNFAATSDFVIGVGHCVQSRENIEYSYKSALDALKYSFYLGKKTVIHISDFETHTSTYNYQYFYNDTFYNNVKTGDTKAALNTVTNLFQAFKNNHEDINIVHRICHEIIAKLSICLIQCGQNPNTLFNKTDVWLLISRYTDIGLLETFMRDTVEVTISHVCFTRTNKNRQLIQEVKKYIVENPSTSLVGVAEQVQISPNYLSNIFSNETGITIKNYIKQERINCAKEWLSNSDKTIYEIAADVGYKTAQHFSVAFKEATGVTPSVFRSHTKQGNES